MGRYCANFVPPCGTSGETEPKRGEGATSLGALYHTTSSKDAFTTASIRERQLQWVSMYEVVSKMILYST